MERIINLRNQLRKEMISFLDDIVDNKVKTRLNIMSTDDLFFLCDNLKSLKVSTEKKNAKDKYVAYTDGGYSQKNGKGAGAYVILLNNKVIKKGGTQIVNGTNNVAELVAIQCALKELPQKAEVTVRTDSKYAIGVLTGEFNPVKNTALITEILDYIKRQQLSVGFLWVKGHNGNQYNEECDKLCNKIAGCDLNAEYAKYQKK